MTSHGQLRLDFAAAPDATVAVPLPPESLPAPQPAADGKAQQATERREFALNRCGRR